MAWSSSYHFHPYLYKYFILYCRYNINKDMNKREREEARTGKVNKERKKKRKEMSKG